ncbi:hypothetical protein NUACC21_42960 [Scytonema sp. NUACC21]
MMSTNFCKNQQETEKHPSNEQQDDSKKHQYQKSNTPKWNWQAIVRISQVTSYIATIILTFLKILEELGLL